MTEIFVFCFYEPAIESQSSTLAENKHKKTQVFFSISATLNHKQRDFLNKIVLTNSSLRRQKVYKKFDG